MLKNIKNTPFYPFIYFSLISLCVLSTSRLLIAIWQYQRVSNSDGWFVVLLQGIRVDIATICILIAIPGLISSIHFKSKKYQTKWNFFITIYLSTCFYLLVFMEMATPSFINEYNIRPNRLFIEYLIYPKEVFSTLLKSHFLELFIAITLSTIASILIGKKINYLNSRILIFSSTKKPIAFIFCFLLLFIGGRSTFGHRPLNPAMVYFSTDPLINSLTLNSLYSVGFSTKQLLSENSDTSPYGKMLETEIIQTVRQFKGIANQPILDKNIPTLSHHPSSYKGQPKNLVIILEESLGARFVGSLGGLPLTPNLDSLSKQGWYFRSMLATGTRSVRGIEAVITGFTPTPDRAVVKLNKSQKNFFTIAELLKRNQYHTEFIYGGEAHFDNMKSFFLGNGFSKIIEESDYESPVFMGSWGVSDEDLFTKAHERFNLLNQNQNPFFSLVFTSSNHTPFEYPKGRIKPYDNEINSRNNAIQYADWALGNFFEKAQKSNYWNNTIFLIIADHDANAQGSDLVPPKSFHIPAIILGKNIPVKTQDNIVSQLDMPPTLLSLIGIDNFSPMLGKDLTQPKNQITNVAIMQYAQNFALLEGDIATVLQPNKPPLKYQFNHADFSLSFLGKANKQESKNALALSLWGKLAYNNQLFTLPESSVKNKNSTQNNAGE